MIDNAQIWGGVVEGFGVLDCNRRTGMLLNYSIYNALNVRVY